MPTTFPSEVLELLARPNPAVITSLRADGHPVSVPTWYLMEGHRVLVNMDEGRRRLDYLRNDPRVSISVLAEGDWYTHVSMTGRVVEIADDEGLAVIDRMSQHYRGRSYPERSRGRVNAWVEIDRWHGWGQVTAS